MVMLPVSPVLVAGRYRLDQLLSAGTAGELWRGADVELSRPVVVKLGLQDLAGDTAAMDRFRSEAYLLGSLTHRGIPRIFDYGEPDSVPAADRPFLVMEYVDGPSLADLISRAPLKAGLALDIVAQTAAALSAVHEAGFVHAEISPRKIMVDRNSGAKLLECGNAYRPASEHRADGVTADLQSLGIVAYQCLGGNVAAEGIALRPLPASVPASVRELVADLTAEDPARRPASAADIACRAEALRKKLRKLPAATGGKSASAAPPAAPLAACAALADSGTQPLGAIVTTRRRSIPLRTATVGGMALVALAAFAAFRPHAGPQPLAAAQPGVAVVEVQASRLTGLPVPVACARLHRLGLRTVVEWRPTSAVKPGLVTSLRPVGRVPVGRIITVIGSAAPARSSGQPGADARKRAKPAPRRTRPARTPSAGPSPSTSGETPSPSPSPTSPTPTDSPSPTSAPSPGVTSPAATAAAHESWLAGMLLGANWAAWL